MLDTPIEYLKGVGPVRAEVLKKELGIFTYKDLLEHYPFRYIDKTSFQKIAEINLESGPVQLRGKIEHLEMVGPKRGGRLSVLFRDNTGLVELVWFKAQHWMASKLQSGKEYILYGKPTFFNGKINFAHPEIEMATEESLSTRSPFQPVYHSTEKLKVKGLESEGIRKLMKILIDQLKPENIQETFPQEMISDYQFISKYQSYSLIHFPNSESEMTSARKRIKFEELFFIQLRLLRINKNRKTTGIGFHFKKVGEAFTSFFEKHLPYELTGAQKRVLKEIRTDTGSGRQMHRLIQGDVGSGKTLVALMSMLIAIDNNFQCCMMAPTEILAQQHFETFSNMLGDMDIRFEILTGSTPAKKRKIIDEKLLNGELQILIGTHALIEDNVQFKNLGLAVIDEQHRFGVAQRAKLSAKNIHPPHVLLMTATPIPRTLAMTLYGDLDSSIIDELPPGRKAIKTVHYFESQRLKVFGFIKEQVKLGRQVYIVYPLIQESEKMDLRNLQEGYDHLLNEFPPPEFQISIVHGKLKNDVKEKEMQRFVKGETQIMVATTVIEVGVNVPNASVMIIESAERFGLAQLHQLRGRVGRGAEQSYCILMSGNKLSRETKTRLETMVRTNDGFEISEVDLKLRGPGDIEGTVQSGVMDLKLADLARDGQILQMARQCAEILLEEDPNLQLPKNNAVLQGLNTLSKAKKDWSKIG
ncbi:MAG: ATP-dependent DNA helicase RecG [Sphingobacteriaceae bacterium]|nr:ATP-dependent DNA helicase RecG [Sphingobacteriaceae bacterium]